MQDEEREVSITETKRDRKQKEDKSRQTQGDKVQAKSEHERGSVSTPLSTRESDSKRQGDGGKRGQKWKQCSSSRLSGMLIYGYSSDSEPEGEHFSPACPTDWVEQMKPILFVEGMLTSCRCFLFCFLRVSVFVLSKQR